MKTCARLERLLSLFTILVFATKQATTETPEPIIVCESFDKYSDPTCNGTLASSYGLVFVPNEVSYRPNFSANTSLKYSLNFTEVAIDQSEGHFIQLCNDKNISGVSFSDLSDQTKCLGISKLSISGQFSISNCISKIDFRLFQLRSNSVGLILFPVSPSAIRITLVDHSGCSCRAMLDNCTVLPVCPHYNASEPTCNGQLSLNNVTAPPDAYEIQLLSYPLQDDDDIIYSVAILESYSTEDLIDVNDFEITRYCHFSVNANTLTVDKSCGKIEFEGLYIRNCSECFSVTIFLVDYVDCDEFCNGSCGEIGECGSVCLSKTLEELTTPSLIPADECERRYCEHHLTCVLLEGDFIVASEIVLATIGSSSPVEITRRIDEILESFKIYSDFRNGDILLQLAEIFSRLFNDANWPSTEGAISALGQIETLGAQVIELLLDNLNYFQFTGENFRFTGSTFNRSKAVDGIYQFSFESPFNSSFSATVDIPFEVVCEQNETQECSSSVTLALANNLADYVHDRLLVEDYNNTFMNHSVVTELLSLQVGGVYDLDTVLASHPVKITFNISDTKFDIEPNMTANFSCVFWNYTERSWSVEGVETILLSNSTVLCTTTHLTSFAVLVSLSNVSNTLALQVVSYIGLSISIISLIATIICLLVFRKVLNKGPLMYVHLNLALALLLAYLVFIAGVEAARPIEGLCIFIAALTQYLFLASFCWMLCEAIMLYLLVVKVFGSAAQNWYWLLIIGWVLPLPIPVITAAVLQSGFIHSSYCYLVADYKEPAIWTFVVPMLLIIIVNTVILIMTVVSIARGKKYGGAGSEVKTRTLVVSALRGAVILLPLLGITWVIGLFAINENTLVFAWLFVLFNSLQGFFIFIFHVVRNKALWRKMEAVFCSGKSKRTLSDHSTSDKPQFKTEATFIDSVHTTNSPSPTPLSPRDLEKTSPTKDHDIESKLDMTGSNHLNGYSKENLDNKNINA